MSRAIAAGYVGLLGAGALVGKLTLGLVVDRLPAWLVCAAVMLLEAVCVAALGLLPTIGFLHGGSLPCKSYFVPRVRAWRTAVR